MAIIPLSTRLFRPDVRHQGAEPTHSRCRPGPPPPRSSAAGMNPAGKGFGLFPRLPTGACPARNRSQRQPVFGAVAGFNRRLPATDIRLTRSSSGASQVFELVCTLIYAMGTMSIRSMVLRNQEPAPAAPQYKSIFAFSEPVEKEVGRPSKIF